METLLEDLTTVTCSTMPRILIADDQMDVLEALRLLLKGAGYQIEAVTSPAAILDALRTSNFDLLLMDLNYARDTTSGREGLDLLSHIQALDGTLPIVVMTAWGSVELAVEAMRRGVRDFVLKPWENARLLTTLRAQIDQGQVLRKKQRLETEKEREFQEARQIQQDLLPKEIPQIAGYDVFATWQPASLVGGDYFDALKFNGDAIALCIADVMGKGMPAALLMSNLQAAVKAFASAQVPPNELCAKVNQVICGNIAVGKFITFFYGLLDAPRKRLVYTNAGHHAPILVRQNRSHVRLQEGGPVLGVFVDGVYHQSAVELASGDQVIFFTDGLTEVMNATGEEFGEERLIDLLVENRWLGAAKLQKKVFEAVAEFSDGDFRDDATLIVMSVQ